MVEYHMEENKTLIDYALPSISRGISSIRKPVIQANYFEIKLFVIHMIQQTVQFGRHSQKDPNIHIVNFLKICDTFKHNRVTDENVRLILFPLSLRGKAKIWLNSLVSGTITIQDELTYSFLTKYFSLVKTIKFRNGITTFTH